MAQLALRAFAYGVDKIPDSAWEKVPGFKDKEKKQRQREERARVTRGSRSESVGRRGGRRYADYDYHDTGENAHSYGRHREGYSVPRDGHTLNRDQDSSPDPPTDPSPGVPQHESQHWPEPPSHPHHSHRPHYANAPPLGAGQNPNQAPPQKNPYYFPPPPTQAYEDGTQQEEAAENQNQDYANMGTGAEYYSRPGKSAQANGYDPRNQNYSPAANYPPTPNPYAPGSGSPAAAAAAGTIPPNRPTSSSAGDRYRPPQIGQTAGPYDRVYYNSDGNQTSGAAPTREPYVPYSSAMYYNQPPQQKGAYRNSFSSGYDSGSRGSANDGFNSQENSRRQSRQYDNDRDRDRTRDRDRDRPRERPRDSRDLDRGRERERDRDRDRRSYSDYERPKSPIGQLQHKIGTDDRAMQVGALGALAGGFLGHEITNGGFGTLAGAVLGGLGANAIEMNREKSRNRRRAAMMSRREDEREEYRRGRARGRDEGYYSD
ncbi:MAG: hypothetical protein M1820_002022 [Bogoriella megaspora]|nr:MAG: hypothetical protein M1820_002022 [Bogoriella megaspora]